jgi:hypothetical protein
MHVADKPGENVANTLIKLLRHGSLDTSLLGCGIEHRIGAPDPRSSK